VATAARLPEGPDRLAREIDARLDLRAALLASGQPFEAFAQLVEAEPLATQLGDSNRIVSVAIRTMHLLWLAGQTAQAREYRQRALEHLEALSDPARAIAAHNVLAVVSLFWGEPARVRTHAQRVLDLVGSDHARARGDGLVFPAVSVRGVLASAHAEEGRFDAAVAIGEEAVRIARSLRHPRSAGQALAYLANVHQQRGSIGDLASLCRQGFAAVEPDAGPVSELPMLGAFLGHALVHAGEVENGLQSIREAIQSQITMVSRPGLSLLVMLLAEGLLVAGRLDEALAEAERGREVGVDSGERRADATYHHLAGVIAARRDPPLADVAEEHFRRGLTLADELGIRPIRAHCHLELGTLYRDVRRRERAGEELTTARAMYDEMGMHDALTRACAALAGL
jgi:tetratricopeptide (TPR) repeat protein